MHDPCKAVKTTAEDLEAYELLARRKRPGVSFSQVIKLHRAPRRTVRDLIAPAKAASLGPKALDAVEELIRGRKASPARANGSRGTRNRRDFERIPGLDVLTY